MRGGIATNTFGRFRFYGDVIEIFVHVVVMADYKMKKKLKFFFLQIHSFFLLLRLLLNFAASSYIAVCPK